MRGFCIFGGRKGGGIGVFCLYALVWLGLLFWQCQQANSSYLERMVPKNKEQKRCASACHFFAIILMLEFLMMEVVKQENVWVI